ncbi:hypothetical protein C8R45DRAFT_983675 [Mycena sanguinolenta]|nr:hypothetical protein C8R45DRAFT_983675 [Mycena sanguinolenta]
MTAQVDVLDANDTSSLVATLLRENQRPTKAEELEIRQVIPSLQEDVLKIEQEFNEIDIALAIIPPDQTPDAHLTEQFERLKVRLDNARERLGSHTKSLSFSREIPVEVLEVIFCFCLPEDYVEPSRLLAPLLLCQICSAWRKVALVTPLLWNSLSLHLSRRRGAWKEFLQCWLGRSARSPLSISFEGTQDIQYFNDHVVKVLLPFAPRWRHLKLDVGSSAMMRLLNDSMPMLETLEINVRGYPGVYISSSDVPHLRSLTLLGDKTDPMRVHVPWARLTQFNGEKFPLELDKCFLLLDKCKNLTHCAIRLSSVSSISASQALGILPVSMPRLRSLVVIGPIRVVAVTVFFANVDLPNLDTLKLVNELHEAFYLGAVSSLVALARRSNLRSLWLTGGRPLDGLFDMVVAIPSLKEVVLDGRLTLPSPVQEALDMRK